MHEFNAGLAAAISLSLQSFQNNELAALNNAASRMGVLPSENTAFNAALNAEIIDKDGRFRCIEELRTAASIEINRRLEAGTFT